MLKTIEAVLEESGRLRLLEAVEVTGSKRVLVTFLDEDAGPEGIADTALLSEAALAKDWLRPEEDEAWEHLR